MCYRVSAASWSRVGRGVGGRRDVIDSVGADGRANGFPRTVRRYRRYRHQG